MIRRMSLRYGLLGLLAAKPATGYDLAKLYDESLAIVWKAQLSQIYPELNRLLEGGSIRVADTGARGSKTYEITPQGLDEVRAWLRSGEPERASRNEALLRTVFLWLLEPAEAEAYLRGEAAFHRANAERYEVLLAGEPITPSAHLPLAWAVRYSRELATWCDWAADRAAEELGTPPAPR